MASCNRFYSLTVYCIQTVPLVCHLTIWFYAFKVSNCEQQCMNIPYLSFPCTFHISAINLFFIGKKSKHLFLAQKPPCCFFSPVKFLPHNFPSSALPKLLIYQSYCVQRGDDNLSSHWYFILFFTLFSFLVLIMFIFLKSVSPGLICPLERGGWWIHSLLNLIQRLVIIDSREGALSAHSPVLHQNQRIHTQAQKGFAPHWLAMINLISGTLLASMQTHT